MALKTNQRLILLRVPSSCPELVLSPTRAFAAGTVGPEGCGVVHPMGFPQHRPCLLQDSSHANIATRGALILDQALHSYQLVKSERLLIW